MESRIRSWFEFSNIYSYSLILTSVSRGWKIAEVCLFHSNIYALDHSRLVGKLTWTFSVSNRPFTSIEHGMKDERGQSALECAKSVDLCMNDNQRIFNRFAGDFALNIEHVERKHNWKNE